MLISTAEECTASQVVVVFWEFSIAHIKLKAEFFVSSNVPHSRFLPRWFWCLTVYWLAPLAVLKEKLCGRVWTTDESETYVHAALVSSYLPESRQYPSILPFRLHHFGMIIILTIWCLMKRVGQNQVHFYTHILFRASLWLIEDFLKWPS